MNKKATIVVVLIVCIMVVAGAVIIITKDKGEDKSVSEETATETIYLLKNGEYEQFYEKMDNVMKNAMDAETLGTVWGHYTAGLGEFLSIEKMNVIDYEGNRIFDAYCFFEHGGKIVRMTFDGKGLVAGLFFYDYNPESLNKLPEGLEETLVKINEGTKWALNGKITKKVGETNKIAAVIVHGSGSSDMDGTIGPNKVYRDFAWGIANGSIDVLRYDKRTHIYGNNSADDISKLTVKEEMMDDAIAAAKLLKGMGYENVILMGHSLGGTIGPAIVSDSEGAFDGFIALAGSPRLLSEIQADQNLALAGSVEDPNALKALVDSELAKLDEIDSWSEAELIGNTIFGISAYYIKDLRDREPAQKAKDMDIPMLFLQGSADFQVYADKDFEQWKSLLKGKSSVEFKVYNGLNHLFMVSQGEKAGAIEEYYLKGQVSQMVINDIISFVNDFW